MDVSGVLCITILMLMKHMLCSSKLKYFDDHITYRMDEYSHEAHLRHEDYVDVVKYDFILRFVDISLNFTITKERILITQARNSGRFHILIGHEIHQVTIFDDSLKLSFIATIDDTSDVVSEFAIEELYTHENISVLIVCLYMDDRFQIYQISNNGKGNNEPIKPVQKIRRPGQSTKTFLVHYMSNMYLVAGYLESDIGKVAVYRWMDYYFSIEDVKEVSNHIDLIVYNSKQLVILVLQLAEHLERSISHIYVLNDQRKMIKTQEMYFLFNRLPHYIYNNEFYVLRCLASDKCFLYKWNNENLFIRVSKTSLNPRFVSFIGFGYNVTVILSQQRLSFFFHQPLLKAPSYFALISEEQTVTQQTLLIDESVEQLYVYKEQANSKMYLCLFFSSGNTMMKFLELQVVNDEDIVEPKGEQAVFAIQNSCLARIKNNINIWKRWIDIIQFQGGKFSHICCKSVHRKEITARIIYLPESDTSTHIIVSANLENRSTLILRKWLSVRDRATALLVRTKDLFHLDQVNLIKSNLTLESNLSTSFARIRNVMIQVFNRQEKLSNKVMLNTINAKEILCKRKIFIDCLYKSKLNRITVPVYVQNVYMSVVNLIMNTINNIALTPQIRLLNDMTTEGHNHVSSVLANIVNVSFLNGKAFEKVMIHSENMIASSNRSCQRSLDGTRSTGNLFVVKNINRMDVSNVLAELCHDREQLDVVGNMHLQTAGHIINIKSFCLNHEESSNIFNLKMNQTISSNIKMQKIYVKLLNTNHINKLIIASDIVLAETTEFIKALHLSTFVVTETFELLAKGQHFAKHVLGSEFEDYSQLYNGLVLLRGSLKIKRMCIKHNSKIYIEIMRQLVDFEIHKYFIAKLQTQDIESFTFRNHVETIKLSCRGLNYYPTKEYLDKSNFKSLRMLLIFSVVYIQGYIQSYTIYSGVLNTIHSEAIEQRSLATVSGHKAFQECLYTDILESDIVGLVHMDELITTTAFSTIISTVGNMEYISLVDCKVELITEFHAYNKKFNVLDIIFNQNASSYALRISGNIRIESIELSYMYVDTVDELSLVNFKSSESSLHYKIDPFIEKFIIGHLMIKHVAVSTNKISTDFLNFINIENYLETLALTSRIRLNNNIIRGKKHMKQSVLLIESYVYLWVNHTLIFDIFTNSARKTMSQHIFGLWTFGKVDSNMITMSKINGFQAKRMLSIESRNFITHMNVAVKASVISSNVIGYSDPYIIEIMKPTYIKLVTQFTVLGSVTQKKTFNDELLELIYCSFTTAADVAGENDSFVEYPVYITSVESVKEILSRRYTFKYIATDATRFVNTIDVFNVAYQIVQNVLCDKNIKFESIDLHHFMNGVNLKNYENCILYTSEYLRTNGRRKSIMWIPHIVHLICNNYISNRINTQHLMVYVDYPTKFRCHILGSMAIDGNVYVNAINDYYLSHFLEARVVKNHNLAYSHVGWKHYSQQRMNLNENQFN
ncbi:uncharacterized protein LOC131440649 isoform X2 [Malaya genurostris]|uniref:uncharacterized protein LOC131440649 isoform X2 n=1 Tax=Malaya genurostris TaxID=325434 RepID=UPI0026F3E890|nr:uncharacterized protein LOC131440649 isoform X2 [Malaya genurostris]